MSDGVSCSGATSRDRAINFSTVARQLAGKPDEHYFCKGPDFYIKVLKPRKRPSFLSQELGHASFISSSPTVSTHQTTAYEWMRFCC